MNPASLQFVYLSNRPIHDNRAIGKIRSVQLCANREPDYQIGREEDSTTIAVRGKRKSLITV